MISKDEFHDMLQNQFGIYLNLEDHEAAFKRSLDILDDLELEKNSDVFYSFLHSLILDMLDRLDSIDTYLKDHSQ